MTFSSNNDGLHRRPQPTASDSKYHSVFGQKGSQRSPASSGTSIGGGNVPSTPGTSTSNLFGDEQIKMFESLIRDPHPDLLKARSTRGKSSIGDALIGLIPIILLTLILLMFLFAILTVIKAFLSVHMAS